MINDKVNYEITKREMEIINTLRRMEASHNDSVNECGEDIKKFILAVRDVLDNSQCMNTAGCEQFEKILVNAGTDMYNSANDMVELYEKTYHWIATHKNNK